MAVFFVFTPPRCCFTLKTVSFRVANISLINDIDDCDMLVHTAAFSLDAVT